MSGHRQDQGLTPDWPDGAPYSSVPEVPVPVEDDRAADALEAQSIKWNVARIVRLSSGRYALLTHYRKGALDLIKVGTLEELAPHIPSAADCVEDAPVKSDTGKLKTSDLLADLGL
jgi:hypothetical protein